MRSALLIFALAACEGAPSEMDAGGSADGGAMDAREPDASSPDASIADATVMTDGTVEADAPPPDGGASGAVGTITGECGVLDDEILSAEPAFVRNTFDFGAEGWAAADADRLSAGAQEILVEGTAGGSSSYSEAFAFEELARCEGASLVKSETEIVYDAAGPITDMLVRIDGELVGVSVTRAVTVTGMCLRSDAYSSTAATSLLMGKLDDILMSTAHVSAMDRWVKQILFVFADTSTGADAIRTAWDALDPSIRADTIVVVAVSEGMDAFIYFEDRC